MTKTTGWLSVIAINLALILAVLALSEAGLYALMSRAAPTGNATLDKLAQQLYWSRVHLIQYDPDCAEYDPGLSYTLRPGTCTFANDGFSTQVEVNAAGLRDDAGSLVAPAIVVTGDSHAMGWGVSGAETFAAILEAETGEKALNAGISSYGTAREVGMLGRLDLSALRVLVVQYSDNDWWENRTYLENGSVLPIQDEASYAANVAENPRFHYVPGANLAGLVGLVLARFAPEGEDAAAQPANATRGMTTADMALRILAGADLAAQGVQLILLEINTHGRGNGSFIDDAARSGEVEALRKRFDGVNFIRTQDFLTDEDRLFPDGHMNASGHRKVAKAILETMAGFPGGLARGGASQ